MDAILFPLFIISWGHEKVLFTMLLKESWNNHKLLKIIQIADVHMFLYEKGKPIDRIQTGFDEGETGTVKLHIAILLFFYWNICLYAGVRKHAQFVYPQIQSNGHLFLKHAFWWDQIFTACSNVCVLVFLKITGNLIIIASAISISEISSGWGCGMFHIQRPNEQMNKYWHISSTGPYQNVLYEI